MPTSTQGNPDIDNKITVTMEVTSMGEVATFISLYPDTIFGSSVYVYMVLLAVSLFVSVIVVGIVGTLYFINPAVAGRPSIRLSAWLAIVDIALAALYLARFAYPFMSRQTQTGISIAIWFGYALPLISTILTTCIAFHLMLTVLMRKQHIATRTNRYYEIVSFVLGLGISASTFKLFKGAIWNAYGITALIPMSNVSPNTSMLLAGYLWEMICMVFCFVICLLLAFRLFPVLSSMHNIELTMPEGESTVIGSSTGNSLRETINKKPGWMGRFSSKNNQNDSNTGHRHTSSTNLTSISQSPEIDHQQHPSNHKYSPLTDPEKSQPPTPFLPHGKNNSNAISYTTEKQRQQIRRTIQRILIYPIEMLIFRIPHMVFMMANVPQEVGYATYALISIHGIFNFVVFLLNPGLDGFWPWLRSRLSRNY